MNKFEKFFYTLRTFYSEKKEKKEKLFNYLRIGFVQSSIKRIWKTSNVVLMIIKIKVCKYGI